MSQSQNSCPICFQYYNHTDCVPTVLPCGHDFCMTCVKRIEATKNVVNCPMDRHLFPQVRPHQLQKVSSLISPVNHIKKEKCQKHGKTNNFFCLQCKENLCKTCLDHTHINHHWELIEDFAQEVKSKIIQVREMDLKVKTHALSLENKALSVIMFSQFALEKLVHNRYQIIENEIQAQKEENLSKIRHTHAQILEEFKQNEIKRISDKKQNLHELLWKSDNFTSQLDPKEGAYFFSPEYEATKKNIEDYLKVDISQELFSPIKSFNLCFKEDSSTIEKLPPLCTFTSPYLANFHNIFSQLEDIEEVQSDITETELENISLETWKMFPLIKSTVKLYEPNPSLNPRLDISIIEGISTSDIKDQFVNDIQEAFFLKQEFEKFEQELCSKKIHSAFLISSKWIREWKNYIYFDEIISGKSYTLFIPEADSPSIANLDIFFIGEKNENSELQFERDFFLITKAAWDHIEKTYDSSLAFPVKIYYSPDGPRIDLEITTFEMVPMNPEILRAIDSKKLDKLKSFYFRCPSMLHAANIRAFSQHIYEKVFYLREPNTNCYMPSNIYLWALDEDVSLNQFKEDLDFSYNVPGQYIPHESRKHFKALRAERSRNLTIILYGRQPYQDLHLLGTNSPKLELCKRCKEYANKWVSCTCQLFKYCSEGCKRSDNHYCKRVGDDLFEEESQYSRFMVPNFSLRAQVERSLSVIDAFSHDEIDQDYISEYLE